MPTGRSGADQPPALIAEEQAALERTNNCNDGNDCKGALFARPTGSRRREAQAQAQRDLEQAEEGQPPHAPEMQRQWTATDTESL